MARDMTPVLKRCRSLDLDPVYLGIDKKSKRNARTGKKLSEYGQQSGGLLFLYVRIPNGT